MISGRSTKAIFVSSILVLGVGSAFAQASVSTWFNLAGSASNSQPTQIAVAPNSSVTLSTYIRTSNIGPLSQVGLLLGHTTATSSGSGATPAANGVTYASSVHNSNLGSPFFSGQVGGTGSGTRPYGIFNAYFTLSSFTGTGDNIDFKVFDATLNIGNLPGGTIIPITIWSANSDLNSSYVYDDDSMANVYYPTSYTASLVVTPPVPEPASMVAILAGLGVLAKRRRK